MVTIYNYKSDTIKNTENGEEIQMELRGLSTDNKPTEIDNKLVANGSSFIEIDTGAVYLYNATAEEWNEV